MKHIMIGGMVESSAAALGCMRICRVPLADARKVVHQALDLGIRLFDHADVYGFGKSEEIFGEILDLKTPSVRERIQIQSKCTLIRDQVQTLYNDQSKEHIIKSAEASLKRLGTDYLDMFLLHHPDTLVEPEEVAEAFDYLHSTGKVRYFGVSNHKPMQVELLKTCVQQPLIMNQLQFSVAHPDLVDASQPLRMQPHALADTNGDVLTYSRIHKMTIQAWSPFQFGFYGGPFMDNEQYPELNQVAGRLAEESQVSKSAIAIAWILRHPAKIQPLIGTTNAQRLRDICTGINVELTREEWYELYRAQLRDEGKSDLSSSVSKQKK